MKPQCNQTIQWRVELLVLVSILNCISLYLKLLKGKTQNQEKNTGFKIFKFIALERGREKERERERERERDGWMMKVTAAKLHCPHLQDETS